MREVALDPVELRSVWETGAEFLAHYLETDPPRFFHPVPRNEPLPPNVAVGDLISVTIDIREREAEVHLHARVLDRRDGTERRGLTLETLPEERDRMEFVLVAARGESLPYLRRRHSRVPYRASCRVTSRGRPPLAGETTNLNAAGVHLAVEPALPRGAEVEVAIDANDTRAWTLRGRVVEVIEEGPQRGLSIEFLFSSARQRDDARERVERLRGESS